MVLYKVCLNSLAKCSQKNRHDTGSVQKIPASFSANLVLQCAWAQVVMIYASSVCLEVAEPCDYCTSHSFQDVFFCSDGMTKHIAMVCAHSLPPNFLCFVLLFLVIFRFLCGVSLPSCELVLQHRLTISAEKEKSYLWGKHRIHSTSWSVRSTVSAWENGLSFHADDMHNIIKLIPIGQFARGAAWCDVWCDVSHSPEQNVNQLQYTVQLYCVVFCTTV